MSEPWRPSPGERRSVGPEVGGLALIASSALLALSGWAPWGASSVGLLVDDADASGWQWLGGGADVVLAVAIAVTVVLGLMTLSARAVPRPLVWAGGAAMVANLAMAVFTGLDDRERVVTQAVRDVRVSFSLLPWEGPTLMAVGSALAVAGLWLSLGRAPGRLTGTARMTLAGAALTMIALFPWWTWSGDQRVNAWQLYDWAHSTCAILAALAIVAASVRQRRVGLTLVVLTVVAVLADGGSLSAPAGIRYPLDDLPGLPVGPGVLLAACGVGLMSAGFTRRGAQAQ